MRNTDFDELSDPHLQPSNAGPMATKRKRRTSSIVSPSPAKHSYNLRHGIHTPPQTPQKKRRVRFSRTDPVIPATGLTPFIRRTTLGTPSSRHAVSASSRWASSLDDSPICGPLRFEPLRQVLTGRVKRRIRRNGLSEEVNAIESERKHHENLEKEAKILRQRLAEKDAEIAWLLEEQEIASQIEDESGSHISECSQKVVRISELEHEISELRAELARSRLLHDEQDWTMAVEDVCDIDGSSSDDLADDAFLGDESSNDFLVEATDIFTSTPMRQAPFSPPNTMPNTPSTPDKARAERILHSDASAQTSMLDPEVARLHDQLRMLQSEIDVLSMAVESSNATEHRLYSKLSTFPHDGDNLDSALDNVLTTLTLSLSNSKEHELRLATLARSLNSLCDSMSPEESTKLILAQFRRARIELERLHPGETPEGFENAKLLELLLARIKFLIREVADLDATVDACFESETGLRQQLSGRVAVARAMEESLTEQAGQIITLTNGLSKSEANVAKLNECLQIYEKEIADLQTIIRSHQAQHVVQREEFDNQLQLAKVEGNQRLLNEKLQHDVVLANYEGLQMLVQELEPSYRALMSTIAALQAQVQDFQLKTSDHDFELAAVQAQLDTSERALRSANGVVFLLKAEIAGLEAQVIGEQVRYEDVLDLVRHQLSSVISIAHGFSSVRVETPHDEGESSTPCTSLRERSCSVLSARSVGEDDCRLIGDDRVVVVLAEARRSAAGFYEKLV